MGKDGKGTIFGIQRFSIHDGPGIRTVVFLKGCPLRCIWCHNPEGISHLVEGKLLNENSRLSEVSKKLIKSINEKKLDYMDSKCKKMCVLEEIELVGMYVTVESVIKEVIRDKRYYDTSFGGITISGGEPMFQMSFLLELLKQSKEKGISTALETSGYASIDDYYKVAPYVDYFLWDYKESNPMLSKNFIGVTNDKILENLANINSLGKKIILRCPIIPSLNDRDDHFKSIAKLTKEYENIQGFEIMPYHNLGIAKAKKMEFSEISSFTVPSKELVDEWRNKIIGKGGKPIDWSQFSR